MKYFAITENGVIQGKNLNLINRQLKSKIEETEFYSSGADRVVQLKNEDIEFIQDKKRLAAIPIGNLYKSDNMQKYILIFVLILQFITLVKK